MTSKGLFILTASLLLGPAGVAWAQGSPERLLVHPDLRGDRPPTLEQPLSAGRAVAEAAQPVWTAQGLWLARPSGLGGLRTLAEATAKNDPVWDPSSQAWYAFAYGTLVKVEADGRLPVILPALGGHDFDIRAGHGLVVYRDTAKDEVVLQRLGGGERRVLLTGSFYNPRFSPDGAYVLVSQLKNGGGHLWLVSTASGSARDLGPGYTPAWSPDGKWALFLRLEDDGEVLTASTLMVLEPQTGSVRTLAAPRRHVVTVPALSPDGQWLAFVDAASGDVMVARLSDRGGAR